VRGSFTELRMSGSERVSRTSFYCAEAGLNAARPIIGANVGQWNTILSGGTPTFTYPITGSVQNGVGQGNDYIVTIVDNVDEDFLHTDPHRDNDLTVVMVSVCTSSNYNGTTADMGSGRELHELVTSAGPPGGDYRYQAGHSSTHSGNEN
jgi:hypothetical protein